MKEISFKFKDYKELTDKEKQIIGGNAQKSKPKTVKPINWSLENKNGRLKLNNK